MADERVLVVEDEKELAEIVRDYLQADGLQVRICADGSRALDAFARFDPHLVILDLMLPGTGGMDLCRSIRAKSAVPIVILSARSAEADKVRGLGLGADDYVVKPFSPGELMARVKAHLRRAGRGAVADGRGARFGGVEMDFASRTVRVRGTEVEMAAKEFDLLAFLVQHPRQVFSKEVLFDRVWGEERFGDIGTVAVHVRRIREKIEADPSAPVHLKTVWGAGYRFDGGDA
jgi:DNA-binding response OmpR family regulator